MIVTSNTSPLLNLLCIGEARLLDQLFKEVWIPPAVEREIRALQAGNSRFSNISFPAFARTMTLNNPVPMLGSRLHPGEIEAIALSLERSADLLLIDEEVGRTVAVQRGVRTMGVLGVLLMAKRHGLISEVKSRMQSLETQAGFWMSPALRAAVLAAAGER